MKKLVIVGLALCLCSGCCSGISVTYNADPPGATIYEGGRKLGTAPYYACYSPNEYQKSSGSMNIIQPKARWLSGAEAVGPTTLPTNKGSRQFTFFRPTDAPGLDIDISAYQRQQQPAPVYMQPAYQMPVPQQKRCTTSYVGNQAFTTCQ